MVKIHNRTFKGPISFSDSDVQTPAFHEHQDGCGSRLQVRTPVHSSQISSNTSRFRVLVAALGVFAAITASCSICSMSTYDVDKNTFRKPASASAPLGTENLRQSVPLFAKPIRRLEGPASVGRGRGGAVVAEGGKYHGYEKILVIEMSQTPCCSAPVHYNRLGRSKTRRERGRTRRY